MRLALLYLRIGIMNELQYRANFFVQLLQSVVTTGTGLVVLSLVFNRTTELSGWTRPELLIVMGVYTLVGGIIGFAIEPNMGRLIGDVHLGSLDFILTKPADSQLLVSVREFRVWKLTDVVLGLGITGWGIADSSAHVGVSAVAGFALTLVVGMVAIYCFWLILSTGAFWFVRMEQLQEMFVGLYRSGQYPVTVYPKWLRFTLTFLVPLAFAITVPSEALTLRLTWARLALTVGFGVAVSLATRLLWRIGIRRYSGASA